MALPTWAATYYVDFTAADDSANGAAKETPWKRAPGMAGFAGTYSHSAGDRFIFKGGVTWDNTIAPWVVSASGAATGGAGADCMSMTVGTALCDYYGVDQTWYTGASWTQPIFEGGSQLPVPSNQSQGYWRFSGSYITLDNLRVQNIGVAGVNQGNYAVVVTGHDVLVENMTLPVQSRIGIASSGQSNLEFSGNDISKCSWGIAGGPNAATVQTNVLIHDNTFHDFHDQIASEAHVDGTYFYNDNTQTAYTDNLHFNNNRIYGDWSASDGPNAIVTKTINQAGSGYQIGDVVSPTGVVGTGATLKVYSVDGGGAVTGLAIQGGGANYSNANGIETTGGSGTGLTINITRAQTAGVGAIFRIDSPQGSAYIYNNHSSLSSGSSNTAYFANGNGSQWTSAGFSGTGAFYVYNNSHIASSASLYFVNASQLSTLVVQNNIAIGSTRGLVAGGYGAVSSVTSDYNDFYGYSTGAAVIGANFYNTWASYRAAGYEAHGLNTDPLVTNATDSGSGADLRLQVGSPAIGAGANLSSLGITALNSDKNGRARGAIWDIGAFEYAAPPPPTTLRGGTWRGVTIK